MMGPGRSESQPRGRGRYRGFVAGLCGVRFAVDFFAAGLCDTLWCVVAFFFDAGVDVDEDAECFAAR